MAKAKNKSEASISFTTIISVSLVLYIITIMGAFYILSQQIENKLKEDITTEVFFRKSAKDIGIEKVKQFVENYEGIRTSVFYSEDENFEKFKSENPDLAMKTKEILSFNPIGRTLEITFKAENANLDYIKKFESELIKENDITIKEYYYDASLFSSTNNFTKQLNWALIILAGILFLITITLINNTIRISIFSKRFIIRTMQLVGAKKSFIRYPFMSAAVLQGVVSAVIAILLFIGSIYSLSRIFPETFDLNDTLNYIDQLILLFLTIVGIGIFISLFSTYFALNRYLRLKTDKLYRF